MKVKVLQHHIDQGIRKDTERCAIALALQEQFPEMEVVVGLTCASVDMASWIFQGADATNFVMRFDEGEPVEPFEFEMERAGKPVP